MTGHRPFGELTKDWPDARRRRVSAGTASDLRDIEEAALVDLRRGLHLSQDQLASALGKSQAAVAQIEARVDMKISTLRETIEAMGGTLELVAHFPSGGVRITRLGEAG